MSNLGDVMGLCDLGEDEHFQAEQYVPAAVCQLGLRTAEQSSI